MGKARGILFRRGRKTVILLDVYPASFCIVGMNSLNSVAKSLYADDTYVTVGAGIMKLVIRKFK